MMQSVSKEMQLSFAEANTSVIQSLFASEGFFWLTTAVATGFAAEELTDLLPKGSAGVQNEAIIALFNDCIRNGMTEERLQQAKRLSLENMATILQSNHQAVFFQEDKGIALSKSFTVYWLVYQLMELEWQQILGSKELAETYQFLDGVLADREELAEIERCQQARQALDDDQKMFLRSHWERAKFFWETLHGNLNLFAMGLIEMRQPRVAQS